ncbi:MAG TPA: MIP/aquaporin family protein [Thermoanaerobaculia bacterium]|nr:MIP/aquaporin family protein [Thermoanaerobaculia bacterium]
MTKRGARSRFPWRQYLSEMIGTAFLLAIGLSIVVFMFGSGSPMERLVPNEGLRRLITGFLFGGTGALIALSPVGKVSGAHINPAVTIAFELVGKLHWRTAAAYVAAQFLGAVLGSLPILLWGKMGKSVSFGATVPDPRYSVARVFAVEIGATFLMISLLAVFLGFRKLRPFTPAIFPPLYAFMGWIEGPISGSSTNPARSFGPAVVSGRWEEWWIYGTGPLIGMLLSVIAFSFLANRIEIAKVYHFESDRRRFFRREASPAS